MHIASPSANALFPAYAGVILPTGFSNLDELPFPRIRRGDPQSALSMGKLIDFSPHTQG